MRHIKQGDGEAWRRERLGGEGRYNRARHLGGRGVTHVSGPEGEREAWERGEI